MAVLGQGWRPQVYIILRHHVPLCHLSQKFVSLRLSSGHLVSNTITVVSKWICVGLATCSSCGNNLSSMQKQFMVYLPSSKWQLVMLMPAGAGGAFITQNVSKWAANLPKPYSVQRGHLPSPVQLQYGSGRGEGVLWCCNGKGGGGVGRLPAVPHVLRVKSSGTQWKSQGDTMGTRPYTGDSSSRCSERSQKNNAAATAFSPRF